MPYAEELEMEKYGGRLIEVNGTAVYDLQKKERRIIRRIPYSNPATRETMEELERRLLQYVHEK